MISHRIAFAIAAIAGVTCGPQMALAQSTPHKPIGQTQQAHTQIMPSLIVMNARGATLQGGKLTLTGIAPNSIVFADRPHRAAGHDLTTRLLEEWAPTNTNPESFTKDPPNATISVFSKDGQTIKDAVIVMKSPKLEGDRLTFDVEVLEGDITGGDGPASVFIDIIGRPLTPFSYAGVARRTAWRGAMYTGAAVAAGTAVAAGAAAAAYGYHPYAPYAAPYYRPPCGYYPLPPCY